MVMNMLEVVVVLGLVMHEAKPHIGLHLVLSPHQCGVPQGNRFHYGQVA